MTSRFTLLVAGSAALLVVLFGLLLADVGKPFPGFFLTADYRIVPVDDAARATGLGFGDRVVAVAERSPSRLQETLRVSTGAVRYTIDRAGRSFTVELGSRPFTAADVLRHFTGYFIVSAILLAVGGLVFAQNPLARPNQNFLLYMCLWAVGNAFTAEGTLGITKYASFVLGVVAVLLSVHGWVFFLTYPVNPVRQEWLDRHRVISRLYAAAAVGGTCATLTFVVCRAVSPDRLAAVYPYALGVLVFLALVSFPIKVVALLDTRRRAASPLVNQQTTVLLLGIALGLGLWLALMLLPLVQAYEPRVDPQVGSAFVLLYPLAIAYATVRYRLFDTTVVIRRSVVYTALAGMIAASYALAIAVANMVLVHADVSRSPWFSALFMFGVALAFQPLRGRVQRLVDRTFFRERQDYVRTLQALARSMTSILDLDELTRRLTTTIESVMHAQNLRLLVGPAPPALAAVVATAQGAVSRYQVAADPRFAERAGQLLGAYTALSAEVVVPLRFQDELRGMLVLGPKLSDAAYTAEDLALLETLADQAAVAVANAEAHRQVVDYARELERSLLIRTNLAKFVPDRVRQLIEASPEKPSLEKRETDVTVVFADISGYTKLSARLAPAELDAIVERYFGAFLDEIVKHGGDVNETAGDGLMVIFHEGDHPRAAVGAAHGIHRRAAELNAGLPSGIEPLRMHIGINTGPATLGATKIEGRAGTRWTYTASGLTTNVAARLAAAAQGGEIVVSHSTFARLGSAIPADDLGERELKNVDHPVRLFPML